jgi:hypothetical protein
VPFVLSIGIGFSKAVGAPEGFGMLTVMSVAPIISVLLVSLVKTPVKKAAATLVRVSKIPLQKLSQPLQKLSQPLAKVSARLGRGSRPLTAPGNRCAQDTAWCASRCEVMVMKMKGLSWLVRLFIRYDQNVFFALVHRRVSRELDFGKHLVLCVIDLSQKLSQPLARVSARLGWGSPPLTAAGG